MVEAVSGRGRAARNESAEDSLTAKLKCRNTSGWRLLSREQQYSRITHTMVPLLCRGKFPLLFEMFLPVLLRDCLTSNQHNGNYIDVTVVCTQKRMLADSVITAMFMYFFKKNGRIIDFIKATHCLNPLISSQLFFYSLHLTAIFSDAHSHTLGFCEF